MKLDSSPGRLNVQLPTGYGKSFTNAGCYSILKQRGRVDRLLVVFPTDAQLIQFRNDGPSDLRDAGVTGPLEVCDVRFFRTQAIARHRANKCQVFAVTAQSLIQESALSVIGEMMQTGRWMLTVDEYHHYGINASWGRTVLSLPCNFLLAMSATPWRKDDDSAFGAPDVQVSYREAVKDKAVKQLHGHSYIYRLDAVGPNGDIVSYTTTELAMQAESDSPAAIEALRITRKMRWSPKYVSPLVTIPIERMLRERIATGYKLQALIGAMCVSHARLVCEQVASIFPELSVDWVGTGEYGRSDEENAKILARFCPSKDEHGRRSPTLDVLVHVGMAGEGLDSVHVSEVIHLNKASINNSNNQEIGRASRYLEGVRGHVNFDSTSEYAVGNYLGEKIMDALDGVPPRECEDEEGEPKKPGETERRLPDEPTVKIWDLELEGINSGDPEVILYKKWLVKEGLCGFTERDLHDPKSSIHTSALAGYRNMRRLEAEQHNSQAVVEQWSETVKNALSVVTGQVIHLMKRGEQRVERSLAGDIKKRINGRKKRELGELSRDVEVCRKHYQWLQRLEKEILSGRLPEWLV